MLSRCGGARKEFQVCSNGDGECLTAHADTFVRSNPHLHFSNASLHQSQPNINLQHSCGLNLTDTVKSHSL